MRIIIADDQESAGQLYELMLSAYDCDVVSVTSGSGLMEEVHKQKPDLVITDHFMPDKKGMEIAKELRREAALKSVPILLISGKDMDHSIKEQAKLEVDGFLAKPFSADDLAREIEKTLKQPLVKK